MTAIDLSEDGPKVIAVVVASEHILKRGSFLDHTSWVAHFREVHPRRKSSYLAKLPNRFAKVSEYLLHVRIFRSEAELLNFIKTLKPAVILVDDKLLHITRRMGALVISEKNIRYKHHERLMLLADNLANYFRRILKEKPRKIREELRRFEK